MANHASETHVEIVKFPAQLAVCALGFVGPRALSPCFAHGFVACLAQFPDPGLCPLGAFVAGLV